MVFQLLQNKGISAEWLHVVLLTFFLYLLGYTCTDVLDVPSVEHGENLHSQKHFWKKPMIQAAAVYHSQMHMRAYI
jgi:hypothetical protein